MEFSLIIVLGLLAVAAAAILGPRLGVAAPLLLVMIGIGVSLLPFVPAIEIEPHWILAGVLPPLLYSASVSMPAMEFRREFTAIGGLSVLLVLISAVLLGLVFAWLIPGLGLPAGIALGAIVSPTDAVATAIVKQVGVSPRIVALLEGESLLNDATALVILRSAIAAAAASVSLWGVLGDFIYAVIVAIIIGLVVGKLNLLVRKRVQDPTVNTVISFAVPFAAAVPAEQLHASGLVAAVVAGLLTGQGALRHFSPQHRVSDAQNWRSIEMILEGTVFLVMGLELYAVLEDLSAEGGGVGKALGLTVAALLVVVLVRAAYIAPLLLLLKKTARRGAQLRPKLTAFQERLGSVDFNSPEFAAQVAEKQQQHKKKLGRRRSFTPEALERFQTDIRRRLADIDYFLAEPLGWREGTILVWAGMRGVVTLAAAQTLPEDTPHRALLIFVAFLVAACSLVLQGGSLPWLVRLVRPAGINQAALDEERLRLRTMLTEATDQAMSKHSHDPTVQQFRERLKQVNTSSETNGEVAVTEVYRRVRFDIIEAQREALLTARDDGTFSAGPLSAALNALDAEQISMDLRTQPLTR
ncbi:MAG: cation:proton antiporter [Chloroflexia bacterium]